ncbi:MAG: response regulator transcription factor [Caldilineales bacterium]
MLSILLLLAVCSCCLVLNGQKAHGVVVVIRVLLVNEFRLMANVIASVLQEEPDITVVGRATSIDQAMMVAPVCDVALVSSRLPDNGAVKLIARLTDAHPNVQVLVLGVDETEWEIIQYVEAGAVGYILKDDVVEGLLHHIRASYRGQSMVSPEIAHALMQRVADLASVIDTAASMPDLAELTKREQEVLALIGQDRTNQEIADQLVIEVGTVKNHVHNILRKLNVSSRHDAVAYLALMNSSVSE